MLQTTTVRPDDESFLFQLYASTRQDEVAAWGWDEAAQIAFLHMQWSMQHRSYALQYPQADHRIILHKDQPAGRLLVWRTEDEVVLVDVALLPAFQRQGIGATLIRQLQAEAAAAGIPLRLHVQKSNPARRLYARLGFAVTADHGIHDEMEWRSPPSTAFGGPYY